MGIESRGAESCLYSVKSLLRRPQLSRSTTLMLCGGESDQAGECALSRRVVNGFGNPYWKSSETVRLLPRRANSTLDRITRPAGGGGSGKTSMVSIAGPLFVQCGFKYNVSYVSLNRWKGTPVREMRRLGRMSFKFKQRTGRG
jgi:hypothetical protein